MGYLTGRLDAVDVFIAASLSVLLLSSLLIGFSSETLFPVLY